MFNFFKKKTEVQKLQEKYQQLMKESFQLSKTDRTLGDQKFAEAEKIQDQIEELQKADQ